MLVVKAKSKKRVTVSISRETKEVLDSIKRPGQSYDGVIRELVNCWKKKAEVAKWQLKLEGGDVYWMKGEEEYNARLKEVMLSGKGLAKLMINHRN